MRKLRMGMIGGGRGAFIGSIHRTAATMDGLVELVCGAFSSKPDVAKESGKDLLLDEDRVYPSYSEMITKESQLPADVRMDFVSIVTPNNIHFQPAMLALAHGFNVMIEKPVTFTLEEAKILQQKVEATGLLLGITHTYSGYPMVKQARQMIKEGALGKIRKIIVIYPQGWLSQLAESKGNRQAAWRTDPAQSGKSGCMGDIGTHAAHLAAYVSGLQIQAVCADLNIVVEGRALDDDGNVLLKFENGAAGVLIASQIATGEENALSINVYGTIGGLQWAQQEPNSLIVKWQNRPTEILRAGATYANPLSSFATHNIRTPAGHPEGYIEAFANIYRNFSLTLQAKLTGNQPPAEALDFPTIADGVSGMAFIETVVASGQSTQKWTPFIQ